MTDWNVVHDGRNKVGHSHASWLNAQPLDRRSEQATSRAQAEIAKQRKARTQVKRAQQSLE